MCLSYDGPVSQWIMSCHKNRMSKYFLGLGHWRVGSRCYPWQRCFLLKLSAFKVIKVRFKQSYDKENITLWSVRKKLMKLGLPCLSKCLTAEAVKGRSVFPI